MDKYTYLTFDQRREIEKLHNADVRVEEIAAQIGRSVAAVYCGLQRNKALCFRERFEREAVQSGQSKNHADAQRKTPLPPYRGKGRRIKRIWLG